RGAGAAPLDPPPPICARGRSVSFEAAALGWIVIDRRCDGQIDAGSAGLGWPCPTDHAHNAQTRQAWRVRSLAKEAGPLVGSLVTAVGSIRRSRRRRTAG